MRWYQREFLALLMGCQMAGCAGLNDWDKRYGPDPAMPVQEVRHSVDHQEAIMESLYRLTNCENRDVTPACSYQVAVAGFNFIDEQCDAYLRELFIIDKERDRAKSFIGGADKLTNAVLAVSPASKVTMAIVAQAFGLTSSYLDVATDSYLYQANSGSILHVVSELQKAYRNQSFAGRGMLVSVPDIYGQIRGYLKLCMPPTIESEIEKVIAKTTAVASTGASSGPGTLQSITLQGANE